MTAAASSPARRRLRIALRVVPVVLLGAFVWQQRLWEQDLPDVPAWPLLAAIALNFLVYMPVKAFRWRIAIANPPPFLHILAAMLEGLLANIVVGLGSGDVVRSARLRREAGTFATDLGAALAERATEYVALSGMLLATWILGASGPIAGVLAAAFIGGYVAILVAGPRVVRGFRRWPRIAAGLQSALTALTPAKVVQMTALSLAGWATETGMLMLCLYAFGLPSDAGTAALVLVGINAAIAIPAAPANVGTFEAGVVAALAFRGADPAAALTFALAYHLLMVVPTAAVAALLFFARGAGGTSPEGQQPGR